VLAETAAAAVLTSTPSAQVLAQLSHAAGLLHCRIQLRGRGLAWAVCCAITCFAHHPTVCALTKRPLYLWPVHTHAPATQPQPCSRPRPPRACRYLQRAYGGRRAACKRHGSHGQREGQGHRHLRVAETTHLGTLLPTAAAASSRWDPAVQRRQYSP
jgi:hypothetical protein